MNWTDTGLLQKVTGSGKSTLSLTAKSSASFTYDADGARVKKSVITKGTDGKTAGTETVTYRYNNGLLLSEKRVTKTVKGTKTSTEAETLRYYYDENGRVVRLGLVKTNSSGTETETGYFLLYNGQGDVTAIYRSSDGALMGTYEYDLWGKPVRTVKTEADTKDITDKNPIRYRSYYYDTGTGLYYLNARYYDPSVRRFLNADSLAFMGGGDAVSYNLYAYCLNNPINRADQNGHYSGAAVAESASWLYGSGTVSYLYALAMTGIAIPEPLTTVSGCLIIAALMIVAVENTSQGEGTETIGPNDPLPRQGTVSGGIEDAPDVDAGKQGKHVKGHHNSDSEKSQWKEGTNGVQETQEGWIKGQEGPNNTKVWDTGRVIGSDGETAVRVHSSRHGIHGYPVHANDFLGGR